MLPLILSYSVPHSVQSADPDFNFKFPLLASYKKRGTMFQEHDERTVTECVTLLHNCGTGDPGAEITQEQFSFHKLSHKPRLLVW
jgi:hypothetical protein